MMTNTFSPRQCTLMKQCVQYPLVAIVICLLAGGCAATSKSQEHAASTCSSHRYLGSNESLKHCSPDDDRDGIPDLIDACLNTPEETVVDQRGCAPRSTTPASNACRVGAALWPHCAKRQLFVISDWAGDQSNISPRSVTQLNDAVQLLKRDLSTVALIEGHSDSKLSATYNYRLALKRALIVRDALVAEGIPAHRISTRSLGEARPLANNASSAGRAKNRRVEIHVAASFDALLPRGATCDRAQDGDCDGVKNAQDRCVSSPPNMPVNSQGCLKET
ncbi:MAG: OmpA family protein [Oceanococcus sp.]